MNTCLFTPETVIINGTEHATFDTSSGKSFLEFHGTGVALFTGARYVFDEGIHDWIGDGPGDSVIYLYDYRRATRQGDTSSPLGGDDFFIKLFMEIPTGGRPPETTFAGCR